MPIMDGMAATKQIRDLEKQSAYAGFPPRTPMGLRTPSDSRTASSPFKSSVIIVALTASSMQQDRVDALAAGCNDFLTKPVSLKWLNNKIIEWGSIKALQMYGDTEQEILKSQVMKAANVAEALQLPKGRSHTPSPKRPTQEQRRSGSGNTVPRAKSPLGRVNSLGELFLLNATVS
jgi:osomolarity two-component system, response regulator SSK1